jgi:hypothetical protein
MIELLERQKRLTKNQWKLICTANLADLLDFFDLFLIGYVTAALTKQADVTAIARRCVAERRSLEPG